MGFHVELITKVILQGHVSCTCNSQEAAVCVILTLFHIMTIVDSSSTDNDGCYHCVVQCTVLTNL